MSESAPTPELGLAIAILRLTRGLNQDQLARAAGVTNSALSEYERGKKTPELPNLRKIVTGLGYPLGAVERVEQFIQELREMGRFEAQLGAEGDAVLVPVAGGVVAMGLDLRSRARRVAALVGQAATGFTLLLFDVLLRRGVEADRGGATHRGP